VHSGEAQVPRRYAGGGGGAVAASAQATVVIGSTASLGRRGLPVPWWRCCRLCFCLGVVGAVNIFVVAIPALSSRPQKPV